jgi:hypothetical protein
VALVVNVLPELRAREGDGKIVIDGVPLKPEEEVTVTEVTVTGAPPGVPPTVKATLNPLPLQLDALAVKGANPVDPVPTLLDGLKMPNEYRTAATITMTRIAQP